MWDVARIIERNEAADAAAPAGPAGPGTLVSRRGLAAGFLERLLAGAAHHLAQPVFETDGLPFLTPEGLRVRSSHEQRHYWKLCSDSICALFVLSVRLQYGSICLGRKHIATQGRHRPIFIL